MAKVFISYRQKGIDHKDHQVEYLRNAGFECIFKPWCDKNISTGKKWLPEIEKNLDEVKVVIMLISANSLTSDFIIRSMYQLNTILKIFYLMKSIRFSRY